MTPHGRRAPAFWWAYSRLYDSLWDNALMDQVMGEVIHRLEPGTDVVEVGAGTGLATARLLAAGFPVTASEPDPAMRSRFTRRLPGVPVSRESLDEMVWPVSPSSTVVAVNVLHCTPDPAAAVDQLRRLAGPDGRIVMVTPTIDAALGAVARAQRRAGVSRRHVARFLALHVLLAPFTILAGVGARRRRLEAVHLPDAQETRVGAVQRVLDVRRVREATEV